MTITCENATACQQVGEAMQNMVMDAVVVVAVLSMALLMFAYWRYG